MNEEIIRNGIRRDCSFCIAYFGKDICELGNRKLGELHYLCSENPNCYFKQLKCLQEENEDLRQNWRLDCLKCEYKNTKADVDKYKQTPEEIRSYCDEQNLKADYTACYITNRIDEALNDRD